MKILNILLDEHFKDAMNCMEVKFPEFTMCKNIDIKLFVFSFP